MSASKTSGRAPAPILQVDFKRRGPLKRVDGYKGLFIYPGESGYYIRPYVDGRQVVKKLRATTLTRAEVERGKILAELAQYHAGLAKNPLARTDAITLRELCTFYLKQGCPRKNSAKQRAGDLLKQEEYRVTKLSDWPGASGPAEQLTAERWRNYRDWRRKKGFTRGKGGDRQIDKERITLSNIYRCAIRNSTKTGITINPVMHFSFERFRDADQVTHCREHMPRSGDELHNIARYFFTRDPRSQVLGWLTLFTARIGHRAHEMIRLRTDAQSKEQPGFVANRKLYLYRSETSKGTYGHVEIDKDFQTCLDAHRAWLQEHYPTSPWYFPSPEDPTQPVGETALTHALARVCLAMDLPKKTSHGLRSFRVNVLRGEGLTDPEVAILIGHKSGGKLIVQVYGEGLDYKLTWMPEEVRPAWESLRKAGEEYYVQPELI